jgi:excisionase family DNA binding protein
MPTTENKKRIASKAAGLTLTPIESTKLTRFGVTATYKMLRAGTLPHIKVGSRFFIPRAALEKWMANCGGEQ